MTGPPDARSAVDRRASAPTGRPRRRRRAGKYTRPTSRWRRWVARSAIGLTVALVLVTGATAGYLWYLNNQVARVGVKNLSGASRDGTENFLVAGSTNRCGLKINSSLFGSCAAGVTGVNSDVVMIVHLDSKRHTVSLLSIPRDLFIPNARSNGVGKIDAALAQGPSQLVNAIQEAFAIPINHYVEVNFDGFQGVVNAVGGIKMYFPEPVFDGNSGLDIGTPGCVSLNGFQALEVVRSRHLQYQPPTVTTSNRARWPYDPESDLSRIRRDHEFLRVLATAIASKGLSNPVSDRALISALAPQVRVDNSLSLNDMIDLVLTFHKVDTAQAPQLTLPVSVINSLSFLYKGSNYGSIVFPDQVQDAQTIQQFLGVGPNVDTMTGDPLPTPSTISVSVLNGTRVRNQAATTAASLTALGFVVTNRSDTTPTGPLSETVVYYAGPSDRAAAEQVAHALTGAVVLAQGPTTPGSNVTLVTGSSFAVMAPSTAGQAPAVATSSAVSVPVPPPKAASTALAPFDPRSCTPSGGEGP